jgi:uncharacterized protein
MKMSFSLFPKTVKFFDLFKKQNQKLLEASGVLKQIFFEYDNVSEKRKNIDIIEKEGDKIFQQTSKELAGTFITPIDREDIYSINITQEEVINLIKAISTRISLYDIGEIKNAAKSLIESLDNMIKDIEKMLKLLGLKQSVLPFCSEIRKKKEEADMLLLVAIGEIYESHQNDYKSVLDIIKWSQIYDRIEQAIEKTESLANIIEGISIKNA